eukprot:CAMPEP_0173223480 /NCGR_PEP_ID=MMETSP1142-20121109/3810_1 /TAXON_ID=483371 /ORGANISM="non described non described, Strain CCMP2298" /LENGTH=95 /DNA_ID=CAMNT_0014151647 /DNA_START=174 /DNA_END=458 /DNA_ORIENTATION=+
MLTSSLAAAVASHMGKPWPSTGGGLWVVPPDSVTNTALSFSVSYRLYALCTLSSVCWGTPPSAVTPPPRTTTKVRASRAPAPTPLSPPHHCPLRQ